MAGMATGVGLNQKPKTKYMFLLYSRINDTPINQDHDVILFTDNIKTAWKALASKQATGFFSIRVGKDRWHL